MLCNLSSRFLWGNPIIHMLYIYSGIWRFWVCKTTPSTTSMYPQNYTFQSMIVFYNNCYEIYPNLCYVANVDYEYLSILLVGVT